MAQWIIYGNNGVAKAKVKELELHDEWMAECFITINVKSATPIVFAVGDYIDYRGERYTIQYDPNVLKKATSGSYGEGFTYDNIKFVGLQDEVVRCDFNDIVLNDNNIHYTTLPTFPFYCETVDDLLDRIQANLEDLYPGQWIIIGLNTVRNTQRGTAVGRALDFTNAYKQYIDPAGTEKTDPYGKTSVAETVDNITCWDALKKVHDDFDLNFIIRDRVIVVGTAGVFTANTFRYGKGNGLKEIERIGESDQRIVTRLRAYGSEENLPAHYYNTVNKQVYANVTSILHKFDTTGADFLLNLDFDKKYFTYHSESYPGTTEAPNYIIEMKANDVTVRGYVTKDATSGKCYVYCESVAGDDDRDEPDATKMAAFVEALTANDRLDFVDYVNRDAFGEGHYDYATSHLPDNMAVSRLMLPGFPTMSLNAWVQAHKNDADKTWLAQAIADGFTFSTEIYRPYIDSPNKTQYGVRPGSVYFDGSDETENIHPTIEGMTYNDAPIDEVYAADQVEDNGVYPAGEEVKPIKITLPNLGFALDKYYEDGASIDMKNGMCGARSFKMTGKPKQDSNNRWVCEVERVHDDSLDLWFPYSDFQIHGSSEVGRDHGDKYVLTGIDMPDAYIDAAAVKLLQYSIEALKKNHAPRYTYQPRINNIFMQRQHDTASASQGVVSLHDTLKAGDVFAFADTDLNIDANVIIDILTIRENGDNGIPDYQVTLRDEKQVGTIQKITNKVDSIISGATSINGATGGGLTTRQIQSLINRYGGEQFLSKLDDDTAQGFITMLKGLQVGANFVPDILGEGGVLRMRQDGKVELVTDILYARVKAYFDSVEIREYQHTGGNRIASVAGNKICRVAWFNSSNVELEQTQTNLSSVAYFRCYFRASDGEDTVRNNWVVGDQAYCHITSIANGSDNPEEKGLNQKHLWRLVIGRNTEGTLTEDGEAYIDLSNRATETISGTSYTGYQSGSDAPEAQDDIIQLGNVNDTTRQGAIVEFVTGTDAPSYQIYQGINSFSLNNKNQIGFGYNTGTGRAYMNVYGDTYIGDRNRNTFLEYKQSGAGGVPELNIKAKIQILPNGSTIDGESISDYIKDNQNNYDDTEVQQAISDLNDAVGNLQDQIDGSIETLYGDVDPSVPANDPYKDYTTDEKEKHLGDMYYNSTTGYAYRYDKSVEEVGGEEVTTYFWQIIRDTGITQAIADAAAALGLAETKAKIFTTTAGTLPTPPYKINDVWVNATYPANGSTYSNEILKCVTARAQGATANIADWAKASKYTDDSSLQNFISATYDPTIAGLTEQVDRKIESWFQSADPSADWYDDTQTPVLDVRADHVGDMWYSESTHLLKRYDSETTGEGEQAVTTYFWTTIQDQKAIDAYDNAAHAQDTADGKRRVFTAQPVAADAYDVGDLWVNATYPATGTKTYENDVLRCKTAKAAGANFNISHWQKASKYTDDSALTNFVNGDYADTIAALEGQLDKKAETWYQAADPSSDWYVVDPETQEVITDTRADHVGDLWYKTSDDTTWYYSSTTSGGTTTYEWKQQNVPLAVFDKIDGKADIFVSKPSTYNKYDMWIIESSTTSCPNADIPEGCKRGDIVIAKNKRTNSYQKGDWEKKDRYTDDSAFNGYIDAFLNGSSQTGDSYTAAAIQKAITNALGSALGSSTLVDGGLMLTSLIGMRQLNSGGDPSSISDYTTWGGISGEYNANDETVEGGAKGHGIAAWYGGDMVDKEMLSSTEINNGWGTGEGQYRWAKSLDRFDGSGYRANGNITWDKDGVLTIMNITTLSDSNNNNILNELATFNSAFTFGTSGQGSTTALYITPNVPFENLYIGTSNDNKKEVATQEWVGNNYVSTAFFRQLFRAFKPNATAGQADVEVQPNTIDATISNIKAMVGFWTEQYVSALGNNSDGGGGGASVLYGLNDVTPNATGDGVMGAQDGYVLTYNGTTNHWYAAATAETYVLPQATANALGGIKIGYAASDKNYAIVLDANGKAYVNVPWTDTTYTLAGLMGSTAIGSATQPIYWNGSAFANTTYTLGKSVPSDAVFTDHYDWSDITNKPTTISGYAITDAYTKTEVDSLARLKSVAFSSDGVLAFTLQDGSVSYIDLTHQHDFQEILERPTTLAGFGIDDAKIESGVITLGNNTITPVTSVAMTVPTGFSISGTPISKTGTLALSYSSGYEGFTTELKNMITALYSWFEVDSNGDIKTKDYTSNGTTKHRGFWSPSFISALGQGSDSGGGGQGDVTWELLKNQATDDRYIHLSYISAALESYLATNNYVQSSDISDMATKTWVGNQGYLTQQSLSSYYTKSEVDALARLTNIAYSSDGILAFTHQDGSTTYADFTHEHSFLELLDRPTTIAGYEISDVYINNGVVYIGDSSITPVTSVAMTVPTGFSISGSPISKTGTLAVSYASGYEGFTTSLKEKIEALFSWFELDSDGNVKTKDYVDNGTTKHRGFWSESFISALGEGNDGGGGGQGDVTWEALHTQVTSSDRTIHSSYIADTLASYSLTTHTHTTTIAADSGTNQLTLAYGTKYKITAGGTSFVFTMPSADDTNTWRNIYVAGTQQITTAVNTKGLNFAAGSNVSLSFAAAGSGTGQNANYGTITINATDTTYSAGTGLSLSSGSFSINSTYQSYISHGESAYNSLSNYLPLTGGELTGSIYFAAATATAYSSAGVRFKNGSTESARIGADSGNGLGIYATGIMFIRPNVTLGSASTNGLVISSTAFTYNGNNVLTSSNSSVSLSGSTLSVKINGTTQSLTNTWRGITDTYNPSSTADSTISLSQAGAYNMYNALTKSNGRWKWDGNGNNAYCLIATIDSSGGYINYPITFELNGRGLSLTHITITFANQQAEDPNVASFTTDGATSFYLYKVSANTWNLYGNGTDGVWGVLRLYSIKSERRDIVTIKMENVASLPTGYIQPTYGGNVNYATSSGKATNDSDGNAINSTYLKLSGGTMSNSNVVTNLNADLLDGTHKSGLFTALSSDSSTKISLTIGGTTKSLTTLYASHAAQLTTSRSLWGQSFDGTSNVSGALSGATTISASSTITGDTFVVSNTSGTGHLTFSRGSYNYINCSASGGSIGFITNGAGVGASNINFFIGSNGNVGVGTYEPSYKLHVNGTFYASGNSSVGGTLSVSSNITAGSSDGTYIQIGGARIVWDNTNKALKVIQSDNSTAANFYATGAISALGQGVDGGGGGGQGDVTWEALHTQVTSSDRTIHSSYISGTLANYLPLSGGTMTDTLIFNRGADYAILQSVVSGTTYNIIRNHNNGNISISACGNGLYLGYENTTTIYCRGSNINIDSGNWSSYIGTASSYVGYASYATSAGGVAWTNVSSRPTKLSQFTNDSGYVTSSGVTSITLKAGTGISLDVDNTAITSTGTRTITNSGVRATTINGNYLRVNTNGTNNDLTIPYATKATNDSDGNAINSTYLKKSGGTMTGSIYFAAAAATAYSSDGVRFKNGSTESARIGANSGNGLGIYATGIMFIRPNVTLDSASTNGLVISSTAFTYNGNNVLTSSNSSVSLSGSTLTVKINDTSQSLTNTWRGIQDNLTSSSNTTESLSAKQGYLLANGSARDNTKLPLAGGTMTGLLYVNRGNSNVPSIKWNKAGNYWGGIGYGGSGGVNVFGAVQADNTWASDYSKDTWEFRGNLTVVGSSDGGGNVHVSGGVTCLAATSSSDIRLKDVQGNVNLNVEQVANAPAIRFLWKKDHSLGMQAGSIAQYWQNVLPETIKEDNEGVLSMNYGVAALVSAITTARKVVDHEREIANLKNRVKALEEENKQLRLKIA